MLENDSPLSKILSKERDKILACVHCGLCLEACPTYLVTGNENDSPRGRIYLMRAVEEGRLPPNSKAFESHINRCLGCRACEQVCPAGVEYGNLLESSRAELRANNEEGGLFYHLQSLLLRHVWLYPKRLSLLFFFARIFRDLKLSALLLKIGFLTRIFPRLEFALALLEGSAPASIKFTGNEIIPEKNNIVASEKPRSVMLFKGCVTESLFKRVNDATIRVLKVNNRETQMPVKQECCGALHAHSGDLEGARVLARRNIDAFAGDVLSIITNAGGCGAMLTNYGHLMADDPEYAECARAFSERVRDISQELTGELIQNSNCRITDPITYDDSCHLHYGQHASKSSLQMLQSVQGVNYVPLEGSEICCGGAGIYNLLEPKLSSLVLQEKVNSIKLSGAEILATGNPGCHMQIRAGMNVFEKSGLKVCHPVEILDESYRCAGLYDKPNGENS